MKQVNERFLLSLELICLVTLFFIYPAESLTSTRPNRAPLVIKGVNVPANQLLPISSTYPRQYWAFPEPDYAWKLLKDLGINVIQVTGGSEGNVLRVQMNENHPYGRAYDADWAQNLEKFLAKADSYGMKVVFVQMGSTHGTLMGIVAPMSQYRRQDPYTSIEDSLRLIDKLGGNNELGKNFISDPRIAYWSPLDEARLDYVDVRDWTIAVLRRIKHYGGKTSVCVNDGGHTYAESFPYIIPIIGNYVDFVQAHSFKLDIVQSVGSKGPSANMYVPIYEAFSRDIESMVDGKGIFSRDQIMLTSFGCGNGAWKEMGRNITTTEHQQADYIKAVFDACEKRGITKVFYHYPINFRPDVRTLGFVNYNGFTAPEPYYRFALFMRPQLGAAARVWARETGRTIYIRPDGSVDPPTTPIQRDGGNLYTLNNNIHCDSIAIMSSNIIIDGKGYTITGPGSYGNGFSLSLVSNVTVKNANIEGFRNGFYLESAPNNVFLVNQLTNNTYGIYLEHSSSNVISRNKITSNEYGIEVGNSLNNNIQENDIASNKYGIQLWISNSNSVSKNVISANSERGVELLGSSSNNSISENDVIDSWHGVYLSSSSNNTVFENNMNNNFCGIFLHRSSNNTFYHNNFMYNTQQVYDYSWDFSDASESSINAWNYDYPYGGNYWSDYFDSDLYSGLYQNETGSDGIGDKPYDIDRSNRDYYPLMEPLDTSPPVIHIVSPENKTYPVTDIALSFTVSESTSWIGYSLNGGTNTTISDNTTVGGLSDGVNNITIYANDIVGNTGYSETVHFTIDTVAPIIQIISPGNDTYTTSSVSLNFTLNEAASWIGFSLDGDANETIDDTNIVLSEMSDGSHTLTVYANDMAGNTGASETIYFNIETLPAEQLSEPIPLWIVATIVASALAGIALSVYFIKFKKTHARG